jgi:hypothetical protein
MICQKTVEEGKVWFCNGAVLGEYMELKGHKTCINNVDNIVVIPNRIRMVIVANEIDRLQKGEQDGKVRRRHNKRVCKKA